MGAVLPSGSHPAHEGDKLAPSLHSDGEEDQLSLRRGLYEREDLRLLVKWAMPPSPADAAPWLGFQRTTLLSENRRASGAAQSYPWLTDSRAWVQLPVLKASNSKGCRTGLLYTALT